MAMQTVMLKGYDGICCRDAYKNGWKGNMIRREENNYIKAFEH